MRVTLLSADLNAFRYLNDNLLTHLPELLLSDSPLLELLLVILASCPYPSPYLSLTIMMLACMNTLMSL
jgi:hypothetical protein